MRFMKNGLAALAVLCLAAGPAFAQSQTGLAVKDAAAATQTLCTYAVGGNQASCQVKWVWNGSAWVLEAVGAGTAANAIRATLASDDPLVTAVGGVTETAPATDTASSGLNGRLQRIAQLLAHPGTATTTITRPADTTAYANNDDISDSTSAPTTGGFTLSNACNTSGGSGELLSLVVVSSNDPAVTLQGEVWIFDSAVTAVNDNAAFALSDSDAVKLVAVIPFSLATTVAGSGTNSYFVSPSLGIAYSCSGSANLRFLVKAKNAYTPASAEQLTVRANFKATK